MFYRMYLSSVCNRREWSEPTYETQPDRKGYICKVIVNNRAYCTDVPYETEELAMDGAAMKAFMICRNFSSNDGYFPGQRPGQGVQGAPVPIGTGRRANRSSGSSYDSMSSDGTSSGGTSPKSIDGTFDRRARKAVPQMPRPAQRQTRNVDEYMCLCRRAPVHAYGRCGWCLKESGWA